MRSALMVFFAVIERRLIEVKKVCKSYIPGVHHKHGLKQMNTTRAYQAQTVLNVHKTA